MRTDDQTLISALRILARDIESTDGVANAAIAEAADRLEHYAMHLPLSVPDLPSGHTGIEYRPAEPGEHYLNHGEWVQWVAQYPTVFYYVVATKGES